MIRFVFTASLALSLLACGEKVRRKSRADEFVFPGVFAQKPASEVISAKYDKAAITCRLWSHQASKLNLALPPRDQKSVDLLKDATMPKGLALASSFTNHEVSARLTFNELNIARLLDLKNPAIGKAYIAQFTPVIGVELQYESSSGFKGRTSKASGANVRVIYENIDGLMMQLISQPSTADGLTPFQDYISCAIQTEIKPEFKDQFLERDLK